MRLKTETETREHERALSLPRASLIAELNDRGHSRIGGRPLWRCTVDELRHALLQILTVVGKPYWSPSALEMFKKCGHKWKLRYMDRIPEPTKAALLIGSAFDAACTAQFESRFSDHVDLPLDHLTDIAREAIRVGATGIEWDEEDTDENGAANTVNDCLKAYHRDTIRRLEPTRPPQSQFVVEFEDRDYAISGYKDFVGVDERAPNVPLVIDQKTAKRKWDQEKADQSLQLTAYCLHESVEASADGNPRPVEHARIDVAVKTKIPYVQEVETVRTQDQMDKFIAETDTINQAMRTGVFVPAPADGWWCGPKYCGYWNVCRYRGGNL